MLGVIFSILCAATFALNATAARRAVLSGTIVQGLMVSMIGAIALSISTDLFLSLADWPDWLVRLAKIKWP